MPNVMTREVACIRCDAEAAFTRSLGFVVQGCQPIPNKPGRCELSFFDPRLEGMAASAAPPPPAAVTATLAALPAAPLTGIQQRTAQAIINLFETSQVLGDYGRVTVLAGDAGHLSFGRSQTSLGSGNLAKLVERYVANPAARWASRLVAYLPRLQALDVALDGDELLKNFLRASADDPVMRDVQDRFFDEIYWQAAERAAARVGLRLPLGLAVVYDSQVHGSWALLRDRTLAAIGSPGQAGERDWLRRYVEERRSWLANHSNPLLRKTVYRMDTMQRLMDLGAWALELPLVVQGQEISMATLSGSPPGCWDGPLPGSRPLALQQPMLKGLDVRLVQVGLSEHGFDVRADALFGAGLRNAILAWQMREGLPLTGTLEAATVLALAAR
ncbi:MULTISPECIES: peptidoglycan-binding protein [Roseateles]|uniref:Chitosanase n=1 Tax=Pelomonas aquatica TaxID=431058 RepID=A0ABU1Z2E2_9BURK|nr:MULTISPECIES: peptidoglycan-binding protein [Roseateles]MDR7294775.1 chitosanase [Pelomonas aquatica]